MQDKSNKIVSVIIVSRGLSNYAENCLASLKYQTRTDLEIIIIDNSLHPAFSQKINNLYPDIKIYLSQENLFYSQALNIGIEMSKGEFILCLNDDVVLDRRFIEEAMGGFSIEEGIGMVSGKILRCEGKTIDSTGLFLSLWRTAKERGYGAKDEAQYEKEEYIFGVNGAVAFYRRKMLEQIREGAECFDSDFHIFYEDLDIAWRAQRRGWKGYYIPKAIAYHVRGGTVREAAGIGKSYARHYLSNELHVDLIKNRYLAIIKNESFLSFLLHWPGIFLYDFLAWGYLLLFRPRVIKLFLLNLKYLKFAFKKRLFQTR